MAKVLNTRPAGQIQDLSRLLTEAGFESVEIPLVEILPIAEGIRKILRLRPSGYTGIFLSSPNGLRQMQAGLDSDIEPWMLKPFYLVGDKSKPYIESLGGRVAFYPREASVDGFLKEYPLQIEESAGPRGMVFARRWLHPCSAATHLDPTAFRKCGVEVDNIAVYRPVLPEGAAKQIAMVAQGISAVLFASGSAVDHFFKAAPALAATLGLPQGPIAVSIGPSTSKALIEHGIEKYEEAESADNKGLVEALKSGFGLTETKALKKNAEGKI